MTGCQAYKNVTILLYVLMGVVSVGLNQPFQEFALAKNRCQNIWVMRNPSALIPIITVTERKPRRFAVNAVRCRLMSLRIAMGPLSLRKLRIAEGYPLLMILLSVCIPEDLRQDRFRIGTIIQELQYKFSGMVVHL